MAYTFGEGTALSPRMSFDMDAQIYKGLNLAAQQERAKVAALAKKMSDAKLTDITGSGIHPLLRPAAQKNLAEGTAVMLTAARSGQDPRVAGSPYEQITKDLATDSKNLYDYESASPKDYLVNPNIQSYLRTGSAEGIDKELEQYPEQIRGYFDPRLNVRPVRRRDIKAELNDDYGFELNSDKYVAGPTQSFAGKDFQTAILNPQTQQEAAIRYASDPEVQLNIMADKRYKSVYDGFYKQAIDQKMPENEASSYALIETIKTQMPSKPISDNRPVVNMPGAEAGKISTRENEFVNLARSKAGSAPVAAPFTLGKVTNIPLGTSTTISKAGLIRAFGEYDPKAIGFVEAKSGMLTQMPIAQKNIRVYDNGKLIDEIPAGDAIDDRQLELIKKTGIDVSAVKYKPAAVYQYEVSQPDPNNPNKTMQVKKYAVKTIQPGALGEMFSDSDRSKGVAGQYFNVHQQEADRLTNEYKASIQQRLEQEKQAKAATKTDNTGNVAKTQTQQAKTDTIPKGTSQPKIPQGKNQPQKGGGTSTSKGAITKGNSTFQINSGAIKKKSDDATLNKVVTPKKDSIVTPAAPATAVTPATPQVAGKGGVDSPGYNAKIASIAGKLGVKTDDIKQIFHHESNTNPKSGAGKSRGPVGLLQFTETTLRDEFGLTRQQVLDMSAEEQLDLVDKYLSKHKGKIKNVYDLSLATLYPTAITKPDDFVIGSEVSPARAAEIGRINRGINNGKPFTKAQYKAWVKKNIKPGLEVTYLNSNKGKLQASNMVFKRNNN